MKITFLTAIGPKRVAIMVRGNMHKMTAAAMLLLTVLVGQAVAQSELQQLADRLAEAVKAEKPEWLQYESHIDGRGGKRELVRVAEKKWDWRYKRRDGELVALVESWSFSNRTASVSFRLDDSVAAAQRSLKMLLSSEQKGQPLSDLGDEAWSWGPDAAWIAMRKGRLTAYVHAWVYVDADRDAGSLSQADKEARRKADCLKLSQEFTRYLRTALGS
jgi:hypothetical protein